MLLSRTPLVLLTSRKDFENPWVGHVGLNRLGAHAARMQGSDFMWRLRCWQRRLRHPEIREQLERDGVAVVPGFLPAERFARVRSEVHARVAQVEELRPIHYVGDRGFGPRRHFEGGFDRWDGGTLNRFVRIDRALPETVRLSWELRALGARSVSTRLWAERVSIYQTVFTSASPDVQMRAHRDTFQPATKLWFFLDDVRPDDGPFEYAPGSHRLTSQRLRWEAEQARLASERKAGGSFRIRDEDLDRYGFPKLRPYPVEANTLVLANVRGFHRRGLGRKGARRLALYGNFRPPAFLPLAV